MLTRNKVLYVFILGFGLGVLWRSFFDFGMPLAFALFGIAAGCSASFFFLRARLALFCALFFVAAGCGLLRFDAADRPPSPLLEAHAGANVQARGVIIDEPDVRADTTHLTIELEMLEGEPADAKVLAYAPRYPAFSYGDTVAFTGELAKPESFVTDTGRLFDYPGYLKKSGIRFVVYRPELALADSGGPSAATSTAQAGGNTVKRNLFALKQAFLTKMQTLIAEPQSALLGGLVLGAKQSLGEEWQERFRETGIIHIVVLSGYNVTIVAFFLMWLFSTLPQRFALSIGVLSIVCFAIMTGASATIVRASIMAILVLFAKAMGRTSAMTHLLVLAGFFMVLHNPFILVFDPSFQLSFLATVGLIWLSPWLERFFLWVPEAGGFREVAAATVGTQIFVMPLLLHMTGLMSIVALPVNLLVLIAIPVTMLVGFLAGALAFVSGTLALPFAWLAHALLSYELGVVRFFDALPFSAVVLPPFSGWVVVALYAVCGYFVWRIWRGTARPPKAAGRSV